MLTLFADTPRRVKVAETIFVAALVLRLIVDWVHGIG
jgi:hypothetical protein